jgi:hypothetical protein
MPAARTKFALAAAAAAGIIAIIVFAPAVAALYQLWFPSEENWDSKVGWRLCNGAIAAWPGKPAPGCEHLHMCANEGALSKSERKTLGDMVSATPGCEPI